MIQSSIIGKDGEKLGHLYLCVCFFGFKIPTISTNFGTNTYPVVMEGQWLIFFQNQLIMRTAYYSQDTVERKKVKLLSHVRPFVAPWTVSLQAPLSMGFSRQEYQSGLPLPTPGDLPKPGIKPKSLHWQADSLPLVPPGKPNN